MARWRDSVFEHGQAAVHFFQLRHRCLGTHNGGTHDNGAASGVGRSRDGIGSFRLRCGMGVGECAKTALVEAVATGHTA